MEENTVKKQNVGSKFFGWFKNKSLFVKIIVIFVSIMILTCLCSVPLALLTPSSDVTPTTIAGAIAEPDSQENSGEPEITIIPENTAIDISTEAPTQTPTEKPTFTTIPTNTPNLNLFRPGTYILGSDIQPGLYKAQVGTDIFDSCYWERVSNLSGEFDSIITNDNGMGKFYVQIAETDFAFKTACEFTYLETLPEPAAEFPKTIDPGMYLVGIDIQPGLYKGQAGEDILESCYWERSTNASHELNAIIANGNGTGQYYIQVAPTDFALKTACNLEFQN